MEFQDQLQRRIEIPSTPQSVVSLVPSQTELLVDLGLKEKITGITKFCVHPPYLRKDKKVVGGTKTVHFEKIKALKPDIILCNKEENTKEMVLELEKIAPVHVSDVTDLEDAFELMLQYGELFNCRKEAFTIQQKIRSKTIELKKQFQDSSKMKVAYLIWKNPIMVAGSSTFINNLLQLNNLENVFAGTERYPETDIAELQEKKPDLVLLSSEPFPFQEKHKTLFAELSTRIELVDGEFFSWYGSRLLKAIDYFKEFHKKIF